VRLRFVPGGIRWEFLTIKDVSTSPLVPAGINIITPGRLKSSPMARPRIVIGCVWQLQRHPVVVE
jgi:hypothetical protein